MAEAAPNIVMKFAGDPAALLLDSVDVLLVHIFLLVGQFDDKPGTFHLDLPEENDQRYGEQHGLEKICNENGIRTNVLHYAEPIIKNAVSGCSNESRVGDEIKDCDDPVREKSLYSTEGQQRQSREHDNVHNGQYNCAVGKHNAWHHIGRKDQRQNKIEKTIQNTMNREKMLSGIQQALGKFD